MKIDVQKNRVFNPVTISITFDQESELLDFYRRLNISPSDLRKALNLTVNFGDHRPLSGLFHVVSELMTELNISKRG